MKIRLDRLRPKNLKQSLLLGMVILVLTSGTVISQIITHRYSQSLLKETIARAQNIAHNLSLDAADKILINDLVALQKLLDDRMASEPGISYLFVIKNGQILAHTFDEGIPANLIEANAPLDPRTGHLEKLVSEKGERFIDYAWPVFDGNAGTLRLGFSEHPIRSQVMVLWGQISLMTLAILAITTLFLHHFIRYLTRPLMALTDAVKNLDMTHLDRRIHVKGMGEVHSLTDAFNDLLRRLSEHTRRIEESNQQLDAKNRELDRTHQKLQTMFLISQKIGAISMLKDMCRFLIQSLKTVVDCEEMAMVLMGPPGQNGMACSESRSSILPPEAAERILSAIKGADIEVVLEKADVYPADFPIRFERGTPQALFPIRHHDTLIGALIAGYSKERCCSPQESVLIQTILNQTAGALNRAIHQEAVLESLKARLECTSEFCGLVGKSPPMQVVYRLIEDVAATDATVLITGESGTGKELVARALHGLSPRKEHPFIVINCSAYLDTLIESELFGHEKGAFTGAQRRKIGRFEQADSGTVFLDEVGEIAATVQIKLLRVLQNQKFERVGGEKTLNVNVRIIAATNRDLLREVQEGRFREDLFYRLNVIPLHMPPLRNRPNDIPLLANHFLKRFAMEQNREIRSFSPESMRLLMGYSWPGNVRELENTIEHAAVLAKTHTIEPEDLPAPLHEPVRASISEEAGSRSITRTEQALIRDVLNGCDWNKRIAAERLGISRSTLYEKLKKYRISRPASQP
jgi:DNA-binding NtrC family response regulator